jgi:hypothetical protein
MVCSKCGKSYNMPELVTHDCPGRPFTQGDFDSFMEEAFLPAMKQIEDAMTAQAQRIIELEKRVADLTR